MYLTNFQKKILSMCTSQQNSQYLHLKNQGEGHTKTETYGVQLKIKIRMLSPIMICLFNLTISNCNV